jgi:hypothetical protein
MHQRSVSFFKIERSRSCPSLNRCNSYASFPKAFVDAGTRGNLADQPTHEEKLTVSRLGHELLDAHAAVDADEDEKEKKASAPKHVRTKSYQFLRGLDHACLISFGVGLASFTGVTFCTEKTLAAQKRYYKSLDQECEVPMPLLALALDQGSVGLASTYFLIYALSAAAVIVADPSHRVWNDLCLALKGAGLWSYIILMQIPLNLNYGPFDGASWFGQGRTASSEYTRHCDRSDVLFQYWLRRIATDLGLEDRLHEDGIADEIFDHLESQETFKKKGGKVALCRWMGWLDVAEERDCQWHTRLLAYLFWGITHGWARPRGKDKAVIKNLRRRERKDDDVTEDPEKKAVGAGDDDAADLFRRCKNAMHVALHILSDHRLQQITRLIFRLCKPVRTWHADQNIDTRTFDKAAERAADAASGGSWFTALTSTLALLQCISFLKFVGFRFAFGA